MSEQLYYEDIEEGSDIPSLERPTSSRTLVMYCAAYEDYAEIHHDKDAANRAGFPTTVVPGLLTSAYLARMLTDWITPGGTIKRLHSRYRRPHFAGDTIVCRGRVVAKRIEGEERLVECEVWAEDVEGRTSTPGTALIVLPTRPGRETRSRPSTGSG